MRGGSGLASEKNTDDRRSASVDPTDNLPTPKLVLSPVRLHSLEQLDRLPRSPRSTEAGLDTSPWTVATRGRPRLARARTVQKHHPSWTCPSSDRLRDHRVRHGINYRHPLHAPSTFCFLYLLLLTPAK